MLGSRAICLCLLLLEKLGSEMAFCLACRDDVASQSGKAPLESDG
jgi:hypothetical protein